jgi:flagellar basal body-associated protein FliL
MRREMNQHHQQNKGFALPVLLLIIAAIAAIVAVGAYIYYSQMPNTQQNYTYTSPADISNSTDTDTLRAELEAVDEGDIEADLKEVDESANSL